MRIRRPAILVMNVSNCGRTARKGHICEDSFAYGSYSSKDERGVCGKDVDGRIQVAWSRWRDLSGVIYDKKVKSKLYKTGVRRAMVYGSECWALHKQEEHRFHTTEMKMLRWSRGKTRKDRIKN